MKDDKQKVVSDYIKFRSLSNHSKAIKDIEFHVNKFVNHFEIPVEDFSEDNLIAYITDIRDKYSITMLNIIKSSYLKPFIKWRFEDWSSRFRNLDKIMQTEKALTKYTADEMISEEDFTKMIDGEDKIYWKAFFLTLFYGGCRPTEVCNLKRKFVEFADGGAYITIYSAKNASNFIKFLPEKASSYLKLVYDKGNDYVFLNEKTGKPISIKGAYAHIKALSKRVLGKSVDLYTLRHSIATIIYNNDDVKDDVNARQMGHTKSMKGKYVHNHKDKLKEQARKIYMSIDELPEERKHDLEIQLDNLRKESKEEIEDLKQQLKPFLEDAAKLDEFKKEVVRKAMEEIKEEAKKKYGQK